ncbi:MAG: TolC family protein [Alphaproteobacteria bacterium]|nr:TolC family protein [Alphaproteobacteria bacterium]
MQTKLSPILGMAALLTGIAMPNALHAESPPPEIHAEHPQHQASMITLKNAIAKAIEASPRLKAGAAGVEMAKGLHEQAGYLPNPEMGVQAENIAGSGRFSGISGAEITYGLSQQIEIGGKRSNRIAAAEQSMALSKLEMQIERLDLERDVHVAYTEAVAAQKTLRLAEERKELAEQLHQTVKKRVQAAREPEIQQSKAKIGVSTANFNLARAKRELTHTKHVLSSLWAGHESHFHMADEHFYILTAPPREHEIEAQLDKTPDLKHWEIEHQRRKALAALEVARAMPNPEFAIGVRDLRGVDEQAFVVGVSVPIPVWNANRGNIASARSEVVQAESQGRSAELTLRNAAFQHLEDLINAYEQAEALKSDIIPSAEKAFSLAHEGYEAGSFPYLEVLDAQRTLFEVKEQYVEALRAYHTASANVERLTTPIGEEK